MTATLEEPPTLPVSIARRRTAPEPLSPRLFAALVAGRAAGLASRVLGRGGGTAVAGLVARRVDPQVLDRLVRRQGIPTVAITGSNGKTTTARLTAALLRGEGVQVFHNSAGSNLVQGVTSVPLGFADLRGHLPDGVLLVEVDEGALRLVAPDLDLRVLLVTDLFRDQLDRYGELYAVAGAIAKVAEVQGPEMTLVVNADDPMVAGMAAERAGPRVTFGFDLAQSTDRIGRAADTIRCPRCRTDLEYRRVYLSHMGEWRCPSCGFERPPLTVAVTQVAVDDLSATRCTIRTPSGDLELSIPQAGLHVAYNAAAAVAITVGLGLPISHATTSLATVRPAFGRLESIAAGDRRIVLGFAKNPTSFNTTLRTLATEGEPRQLLVAVSNTLVDGEDFAWLWDVDFESAAPRIEHVTVSGLRADELANRLKYAGVDPMKMELVPDRAVALDRALAGVEPGGTLVVVAGYTPTIELREEMRRRGWTGRFWEA